MSRLSRKFLWRVGLLLMLLGLASYYLNTHLVEKYLWFSEKELLTQLTHETALSDLKSAQVDSIERRYGVNLVTVDYTTNNDKLNERLKKAFIERGINVHQYWLWDQDQADIQTGGTKIKRYHQSTWGYSLMVAYSMKEDQLVVFIKTLPDLERALQMVNLAMAVVFIGTGIAIFIALGVLVKGILEPLERIGKVAQAIGRSDFQTVSIKTRDELEVLAGDINAMSHNIQQSQLALEASRTQMSELLNNVSHDLKTPIALVKMYTSGMRDGLDDGTFLETIIGQNERMAQIVESLLTLAKVRQNQVVQESIVLSDYLLAHLKQYRVHVRDQDFKFDLDFAYEGTVWIAKETLELILTNLISNGLKYASDGQLRIFTEETLGKVTLGFENEVAEPAIDIAQLWEPFYVFERSRNQAMSGTGLGLSIVRAACENNGIAYESRLESGRIVFVFTLTK